jgi:hypothetical protein
LVKILCLHAKDQIEAFARRNPYLHAYELGDLDDFFWPHTTWYALEDGGQIQQLALLYSGTAMPTLLAFPEQPLDQMLQLLQAILPLMPRRFHAHLNESVTDVFAADYHIYAHGSFLKMALTDRSRLAGLDTSEVTALSVGDAEELEALYSASYPGNWFVRRMLAWSAWRAYTSTPSVTGSRRWATSRRGPRSAAKGWAPESPSRCARNWCVPASNTSG